METLLTILLTLVYISMVVSVVSLAIIFFVLACMAIKFFIEEIRIEMKNYGITTDDLKEVDK